jgi:hypothetical protein
MLLVASTVRARRWYFMNDGMAIDAMTPRMSTTTISSINVKPRAPGRVRVSIFPPATAAPAAVRRTVASCTSWYGFVKPEASFARNESRMRECI